MVWWCDGVQAGRVLHCLCFAQEDSKAAEFLHLCTPLQAKAMGLPIFSLIEIWIEA